MVRPETALPPRTQPETKPPAPRPGENFTDLLRHRAEAVRAVHRSQHWQQYQLQQQRDIELAHAQTEEERRRAEMALQIAVLLSDKVVQAFQQACWISAQRGSQDIQWWCEPTKSELAAGIGKELRCFDPSLLEREVRRRLYDLGFAHATTSVTWSDADGRLYIDTSWGMLNVVEEMLEWPCFS